MAVRLTPFVKWAGGKRQLLNELHQYQPKTFNRYFEPFIGGGAFFLDLAPASAVISDLNEDLMMTWEAIKQSPSELLVLLAEHQANDHKEYYLDVRSVDRDGRLETMTTVERAARFIYMNKAGFNGLWRVNKKGQNNVPYANPKKLNLMMDDLIYAISDYLNDNDIVLKHQSYLETVKSAETGDFVYFDPPYIPLTESASFTAYTKENFSLHDQEALRDTAKSLAEQGVHVMLSNSSAPLVYELYQDEIFHIHEVQAKRAINSKGDGRGAVKEVIITTY